jgi:hypothetical protein
LLAIAAGTHEYALQDKAANAVVGTESGVFDARIIGR